MSGITEADFQAILADTTKRIECDISWAEDEDHSPAVEFRVPVLSDDGYPIFIAGRFNAVAQKLSYSIIHRSAGRVYGLCLGIAHRNPSTGIEVGRKHKHRWTDLYRDQEAYVPSDITSTLAEPVEVWKQFCAEAAITHYGTLDTPPPPQLSLIQ